LAGVRFGCSVSNPSLFNQSIMNYIASDPTLLAQFAGLVALSASAPGTPVNNLVASLSTINFALHGHISLAVHKMQNGDNLDKQNGVYLVLLQLIL